MAKEDVLASVPAGWEGHCRAARGSCSNITAFACHFNLGTSIKKKKSRRERERGVEKMTSAVLDYC